MAGKGGLFAVATPPEDEDDDLDDFSSDLEALDPEEEDMSIGAGPFEAYAETALDPDADLATRTDALRQAFLTLLEESGRG